MTQAYPVDRVLAGRKRRKCIFASQIGAAAHDYVSREFSNASIYTRLIAIYDEVMK